MRANGFKSIFVGIFSLIISGLVGFLVLILRGPVAISLTGESNWIDVVSSGPYALYQNLLIVVYALSFIGFIALYDWLRESQKLKTLSFTGMLLSLWGTALALPALGILSFIPTTAGRLGSADQAMVAQVVTDTLTGSALWIGIVAAICYSVGPMLLGVAIWRWGNTSRLGSVLFILHGFLLSFGFSFFPALPTGWLFLAVSGLLIMSNFRKTNLNI